MPRIEIDINDSTLRAKLAQLKQEGREPGPALTEIGAELKKRIQLGFRTGRSPDGHPWVPIKHRQGSPLLASGRLRSSIDYHVAGDSVTIGTNLVYAALHQFGGEVRPKNKKALSFMVGGRRITVGKVTIPARPYLPVHTLPVSWREAVEAIIVRRIALSGED